MMGPCPSTGVLSMTTGHDGCDTTQLALRDAPHLAENLVPVHDERLQDLMLGQQEVMSRVFGGGSLQDVLEQIVLVCERVFAPAQCILSVYYRGGITVTHQAASQLPAPLLATIGQPSDDDVSDPTASSMLSGERIIVADFSDDGRWPEHAKLALSAGFHSCWVEPVADCGEGLVGF